MKKDIIEILEKDSRKTAAEIAVMLGKSEQEVAVAIAEMEADNIICGYTTLINWEKIYKDGGFVTALIEVKVTPQRDLGFDKIAERIYNFDKVKSVYLMSGAYDLTVIMEGKNLLEISKFISAKLSTLDSVLSTATHFVLKKYKEHGIILNAENKNDERMIVSP